MALVFKKRYDYIQSVIQRIVENLVRKGRKRITEQELKKYVELYFTQIPNPYLIEQIKQALRACGIDVVSVERKSVVYTAMKREMYRGSETKPSEIEILKKRKLNLEDAEGVFETICEYIRECLKRSSISHEPVHELVIMSPFLKEDYVNKFISFVNELRKEYPDLEIFVITRPTTFVMNKEEHKRCIEKLHNSGIRVCVVTEGKASRFHAKIILVGDYIIAGSANPLAPSYFEYLHVESLIEFLIRNRKSTEVLRKLLEEAQCT